MAEKTDNMEAKKGDLKFTEENRLGEIVTKLHGQLADEMKGRPYLMVVTTGYEIGKDGEKSLMAAQWAWRSNVYLCKDEGKAIMGFLVGQLSEAAEHPEGGIKKQYKLK